MPKFRRDSIFGDGPRMRLDREQRAQFRAKLRLQRTPHRLTPAALEVGRALVDMLGADGRIDPSINTITARVPFGRAAVVEGLRRLRACGFLDWTRRLVRHAGTGWRCEQATNAYVLLVPRCESGFRPEVRLNLVRERSSRVAAEKKAHEDADADARANRDRQLVALGFSLPALASSGRG